MNQKKLFSEINLALKGVLHTTEERKDLNKSLKKMKQDLEEFKRIKQLEKELGINLELYINTHLKGVYIKGMEPLWSGGQKNEILHYTVVGFTKECLEVRYRDSHDTHRLWYPLEDYGEIWALTLEELQND